MPLGIRLAATLWVAVLIPVYLRYFGLANFLWFSDISLFMTLAALWLNSRWLLSMAVVSVFPLEMVWNLAFFARLVTGQPMGGVGDYMFGSDFPLPVRILSLFHVWLLPLWIWMLGRRGYDPRAWRVQVIVGWVVLLLTFFLTTPGQNINWVFGPGGEPQRRLPQWMYLAILLIVFPTCVYYPTHWVLSRGMTKSRA